MPTFEDTTALEKSRPSWNGMYEHIMLLGAAKLR